MEIDTMGYCGSIVVQSEEKGENFKMPTSISGEGGRCY